MPKPLKGIEKIKCYGFGSVPGTYSDEPVEIWAVRQDTFGDIEEDADVVSGVADTNFQCRAPLSAARIPKPNWLIIDKDGAVYNVISVVKDIYRPRTHIIIKVGTSR